MKTILINLLPKTLKYVPCRELQVSSKLDLTSPNLPNENAPVKANGKMTLR